MSIRIVEVKHKTEQIVMAVYGPHGRELRTGFWEELNYLAMKRDLPWVVGGGFNLVSYQRRERPEIKL